MKSIKKKTSSMLSEKECTDIFNSLSGNAFEYFEDALESFEENPKHALIFFYTAIELIFKARLSLVDPMWIIREPSSANKKRFVSGKFQSVGLETAVARLQMLKSNESIDKDAHAAFKRIRHHRNKIIHYAIDLEEDTDKIANYMLCGWYHVHSLFQQQWQRHFVDYQGTINSIDQKLVRLESYLEHVYLMVKDKCEGCEKCVCCKHKSFNGKYCRVCGYRVPMTKDDLEDIFTACCGECYGYETVMRTEYGFHCTECDHHFKESDFVSCEYCGQFWIGLDEAPDYLSGCEFCEGRFGQDD